MKAIKLQKMEVKGYLFPSNLSAIKHIYMDVANESIKDFKKRLTDDELIFNNIHSVKSIN